MLLLLLKLILKIELFRNKRGEVKNISEEICH